MKGIIGFAAAAMLAGPAIAQTTNCMANGPFLNCDSANGAHTTCSATGPMLNCNTIGGTDATSGNDQSANNGFAQLGRVIRARRMRSHVAKALKDGDCSTAVTEAVKGGDVDYAMKVQQLCAQMAGK